MRFGKIKNRKILWLLQYVPLVLLSFILLSVPACQSKQEHFDAKLTECVEKRGDKTNEGVVCLENLLKEYPENLYIHSFLADKYEDTNQLDKAEESIEIYTTYYPKNASGFNSKCQILERKGDLDNAEKACQWAIFIDPDKMTYWVSLAKVMEKSGDISEAERIYKQILESEPKNERALVSLGRLYEKAGRIDEAIETYEKAAEADVEFRDKIKAGIERIKKNRDLQQEKSKSNQKNN